MIKVKDVLETKSKVWESGISTDFERKFLISITKDKDIYNKSSHWVGILDMSSKKKYIFLTQKQEEIYAKIESKYNNKSLSGDIFEKYTNYFKEKNIVLKDYDLRHLETFKGVFKESENFKKWLEQIEK